MARRTRQRKVERFLTTVLFTDIVGSTEHAAELGDRGWRDLVQEHHKLVRAALRRHGGREVDTAGDGFFAVFDAPAAAAECALDVVEAVPTLGLHVRAGLHVGEVEQIAGKVGGISVPIGSRIMSAAEPGEVLVSTTVRDLAAGAGFRFEDRGTRELKGVPGEWHLFAVSRPATAAQPGDATSGVSTSTEPDRAKRRAAAVRRSQARPVWQRHPRAAGSVAVAVVLAVLGTSLLVWSPWVPPALSAVADNSIGVIDSARNVVVAQAPVGNQPAAIAFGEGALWIANSGDDTVSQVDPETHAVIDTIDVGKVPTGIVVGADSVWVANSGERAVTRINPAARRVVDTIPVGNGPRAIAFGGGAVWVANSADGTVSRLDAASGVPAEPVGVGSPTAIAADDNGVWVVSEDAGTLTELDPATGMARAAPIAVGARPAAAAIGGGAVWVANSADDSVWKVDPSTHKVIDTIDVSGSPIGLAATDSSLWVALRSGAIERIDPADTSRTPLRITSGATPTALAVVDDEAWFVVGASLASHRGGTMRIVGGDYAPIDPESVQLLPVLTSLVGDGLVGYRRVGGVAGAQLLPDLAISIPAPTDAGLTYSFQLRPGLVYSDGSPIRASDFRFALERGFEADGAIGGYFFFGLKGADACADPPVERCDLSQGIETDDARGTVTFHLSVPDADFLYRLALSFAEPLPPASVPAKELISGPYPATGPYAVTSVTEHQIRLTRNPYFQPNSEVRPAGYVDEVIWTFGVDPADQLQMVKSGEADFMLDGIPPEEFPVLRKQFTPQLHSTPLGLTFVAMSNLLPPFDKLDVRRAVAFAIDRAKIVQLIGGEIAAQPTCQLLPPNIPGYEPYCPYTKHPSPTGQWSAPDLRTARQLVARSHTAGAKVVVGPIFDNERSIAIANELATVLDDLGYHATVEIAEDSSDVFTAFDVGKTASIGVFGWGLDFPAPDNTLDNFGCDAGGPPRYCADIDAATDAARALQATDVPAANQKWAEIDRMITDLAIWAPLTNEGNDFVSARLGNYQFSVGAGFLIDQAWVR
jgi:peptide/nickel transport system substrate-binding protein